MNVADAVRKRLSCRAFRPEPVARELVEQLIETAAWAPSGGNLQPWRVYVLAGEALDAFRALVAVSPMEAPPRGPSPPRLARRPSR